MFRNPPIIGIDIGHHSVKAVVLNPKKEQLELSAFAEITLPSSVINDQHSVNTSALLSAIRKLKKSLPFNARKVAIALPDSAVISKVIQLDTNLSDEEAEFAVTQALSASSPFPVEELSLDFFPLSSDAFVETATTVPFQVFAARKDTIDSRIKALKKAGLHPGVVELQTHALLWLGEYIAERAAMQELWGVVDIGMHCTEFSIKPPGGAAYHREMAFGTSQVSGNTVGGSEEPEAFPPELEQAEVFTKQLADHLKRQFQLYNSTHPRSVLKGIWLCGGGQRVVLEELLARLLGVEASWINPFRYFTCSKKLGQIASNSYYGQYAVAAGLAIRGASQ